MATQIQSRHIKDGTCKAWVNFNGTGTVAIRASYNVSSITDVGTGQYSVNFSTALVDSNPAVVASCGDGYATASGNSAFATTLCRYDTGAVADQVYVEVIVFR